MKTFQWFVLSAGILLATSAHNRAVAVPTIDGTASVADGYSSLSVQNTDTQFGNATLNDLVASGGGSEIDQVFGKIEGGRLYIVIAGNLERNFNKMQVFIDSVAGGVNQIDGDIFDPNNNNVPFGMDSFCCGGFPPPDGGNTDNIGALQRMDGMTFDASFSADYALVFSHGQESVGAAAPISPINFWAINAHYADLTNGLNGAVVAAGIQLGPEGINRVMRMNPADFENDFDVDGSDFLRWQRNAGTVLGPTVVAAQQNGNADADNDVDGADLAIWEARYGTDRLITDLNFTPYNGGPSTSNLLFGAPLAGLSQGDLIDKNYATGVNGGCTAATTDGNTGCAIPELEFVLPVDTNDAGNTLNHRNFENTVGLQLGFNNSNTVGVNGCGDPNTCAMTTTGDPNSVITGVEFSIPLSQIGNPASLSDLKLLAFVNGQGHDYSSNQYAGVGVLQNNLGGDGMGTFTGDFSGVDMSTIAGDQFVTLTVPALVAAAGAVPEPLSAVLLGLGVCGMLMRRRR